MTYSLQRLLTIKNTLLDQDLSLFLVRENHRNLWRHKSMAVKDVNAIKLSNQATKGNRNCSTTTKEVDLKVFRTGSIMKVVRQLI